MLRLGGGQLFKFLQEFLCFLGRVGIGIEKFLRSDAKKFANKCEREKKNKLQGKIRKKNWRLKK